MSNKIERKPVLPEGPHPFEAYARPEVEVAVPEEGPPQSADPSPASASLATHTSPPPAGPPTNPAADEGGTQLNVRTTPERRERIDTAIAALKFLAGEKWTVAGFVNTAIDEKLAAVYAEHNAGTPFGET